MNEAEALRQAQKELDTRGWGKGVYQSENGSVCAAGALQYAIYGAITPHAYEDPFYTRVRNLLHNVLNEQFGAYSVSEANDEMVSSVEEIKACMEKAALKWEEGIG